MNQRRITLTFTAILLWLITTSPFVPTVAVSSHGHHSTSTSIHNGKVEITFHHGHDKSEHSHQSEHEEDSSDHYLDVSIVEIRPSASHIVSSPEIKIISAMPACFSQHDKVRISRDLLSITPDTGRPPIEPTLSRFTVLVI